ncbi:MAG: hypothetical protein ACXWE8_03815 [Solirubrobacterales bacterium]
MLVAALLAPAAARATAKYRVFQDLSVGGPFSGKVFLAIDDEDTNGNGRFRPRRASAYNLTVQASCDASGGLHTIRDNAFNKYGNFSVPLDNGRFSYRFETRFENPATAAIRGDLTGTVKPQKKRVDGAFDIEDWALDAATSNCVSFGSYSATRCKAWRSKRDRPRWWREWNVPVCKGSPW